MDDLSWKIPSKNGWWLGLPRARKERITWIVVSVGDIPRWRWFFSDIDQFLLLFHLSSILDVTKKTIYDSTRENHCSCVTVTCFITNLPIDSRLEHHFILSTNCIVVPHLLPFRRGHSGPDNYEALIWDWAERLTHLWRPFVISFDCFFFFTTYSGIFVGSTATPQNIGPSWSLDQFRCDPPRYLRTSLLRGCDFSSRTFLLPAIWHQWWSHQRHSWMFLV